MPKLRARPIGEADLAAVAQLLGRGLGYSSRFYSSLLKTLSCHPTPQGFPKYGCLLESDGVVVGAILLIFSTIHTSDGCSIRCHVTSWYVEPEFRCYATLFFSKELKRTNVTYINISARSVALPILKSQGFSKYSNGQFIALPLLHLWSRNSDVHLMDGTHQPDAHFEPFERDLLRAHAEYGCLYRMVHRIRSRLSIRVSQTPVQRTLSRRTTGVLPRRQRFCPLCPAARVVLSSTRDFSCAYRCQRAYFGPCRNISRRNGSAIL